MKASHLTLVQRILCYNHVLTLIKTREWTYVCIALEGYAERTFLRKFSGTLIADVKEDFPEFYSQKPLYSSKDNPWWPISDQKSRIEALKKAIFLTEIEIDFENLFKQDES